MNDCQASITDSAQQLNQHCFCKTLNVGLLEERLSKNSQVRNIFESHPHLFSSTAIFISPTEFHQITAAIDAIESVLKLPAYVDNVMASAAAIAQIPSAAQGVFMGYDFHLTDAGPKLIEINTNAGGAFLNTLLLGAQTECCTLAETFFPMTEAEIEADFVDMFLAEWKLVSNDPLKCVAIVDDAPETQFLYPEFKLAQSLFLKAGIEALICDPRELDYSDGQLRVAGKDIDLVYNRLTDFSLSNPAHNALAQAFQDERVLVTPNPRHHALYANKKNLVLLSDLAQLTEWSVPEKIIGILQQVIPKSIRVTRANAEQLWLERKNYFFKPLAGFGSRATYRGDKLTHKVWGDILQGDYIAQALVPPSQRAILSQGNESQLKFDLRAYVYAGKLLMLAARLYQGQTTNFRTQGGGFAPVFVARE